MHAALPTSAARLSAEPAQDRIVVVMEEQWRRVWFVPAEAQPAWEPGVELEPHSLAPDPDSAG